MMQGYQEKKKKTSAVTNQGKNILFFFYPAVSVGFKLKDFMARTKLFG